MAKPLPKHVAEYLARSTNGVIHGDGQDLRFLSAMVITYQHLQFLAMVVVELVIAALRLGSFCRLSELRHVLSQRTS